MNKKFVVLIEDDFEVMGNGLGNVAEMQYLPALALMNIAEKHKVKLTFMVDVAQQLAFIRNIENTGIRIQKNLWDETVQLIKERGFDVQLHLHPQWINAKYQDGYFLLDNNWNLGLRDSFEQDFLIAESVSYLKNLLQPKFPYYQVCAFKAGSWGLQPSSNLLKQLQKNGIKIVLGVVNGLKIPGSGIDYTKLEEKSLPYYPDIEDIVRVSTQASKLVVIPLQPYAADVLTLTRLIFDRTIQSFRRQKNMEYYRSPVPGEILKLSPLLDKNIFKFSTHPYQTHLKIGNQPFSYLKASFDSVIKRMKLFDLERIPVVIESHTKQYPNYCDHIERFIAYIVDKYESELEFGDLSGYANEINMNPGIVRFKETGVLFNQTEP